MRTNHIDRELVVEMIDYALHEAPKHVEDLYLGLDDSQISEVITDTLRQLKDISLPYEIEGPSMAHLGRSQAVIDKYVSYINYLHYALPIFVKKAEERHRQEIEHEAIFITDGQMPRHCLSMIDESPLPGEHIEEGAEWRF